jgi:hypothetical protein
MLNRECINKIIRSYLPAADENLIVELTSQAEKQIELSGREIIRKLVRHQTDQGMVIVTSKIDTRV